MSCPSCGTELLGALGYCARCGAYTRKVSDWLEDGGRGRLTPGRAAREEGGSSACPDVVIPSTARSGSRGTTETKFVLHGHTEAAGVNLAGSFNDWDEHALRMAREDQAWVCGLELPPGTYEYKFVIDGRWVTDPANPSSRADGAGNVNSVLVVKGD